MKLVVTFIFYVSGTFCLLADSPLTSIVFWDLSDDPYVLNIGKIPGKKSLDQDSFQYLINPTNTIDNKYALINALGWEFKSSIKNSDNFLRFLNQRFEKEINEFSDSYCFNSDSKQNEIIKAYMEMNLSWEYSSLYNYLSAMDDYFLSNPSAFVKYEISNYTSITRWDLFIKLLLQAQRSALGYKSLEIQKTTSLIKLLQINNSNSHLQESVARSLNYLSLYKMRFHHLSP